MILSSREWITWILGARDNEKDSAPRVQRRHIKKRHRSLPPWWTSQWNICLTKKLKDVWNNHPTDDEKKQQQLRIIIYRWTRVSMFLCACPPLAQIMKERMPGSQGESVHSIILKGFFNFTKKKVTDIICSWGTTTEDGVQAEVLQGTPYTDKSPWTMLHCSIVTM